MKRIKILVVDDEAVVRDGLKRVLDGDFYAVDVCKSGHSAIEQILVEDYELIITDLKMPGMSGIEVLKVVHTLQPDVPVIMISGYATVDTAVEAMKNGAVDYIAKPFTPEQILGKVEYALEQRSVMIDEMYLKKEIVSHHGFGHFVGESREMQKVYRRIMQVAPTGATVLISGESGTGKELVARAIHDNSPRREHPFVAVDCTSLAENLLESELFGHVKGSFTGAVQTKMGLFKVADNGTLFLDEISNISLTIQAKLLRVLQERQVTPIGGTQPIHINIHLVAATNRNLKIMVTEGTFREDLYFRLNIIPIELPSLRDRRGDIPLLISHFLKRIADDIGKDIRGLAPDAMALLETYPFPGNVRELENIIERAVVLAESDIIARDELELFEDAVTGEMGAGGYVPATSDELKEMKKHIRGRSVETVEKVFIMGALERNNWNITRAAEETGMLRPNFQGMLKRLGISVKNQMAR